MSSEKSTTASLVDPTNYDYSGLKEVPSEQTLTDLGTLAAAALQCEADAAEFEAKRKASKAQLAHYKEKLIPAALERAGVPEFMTAGGVKISTEQVVYCSIAKNKNANAEAALDWLDENGYSGNMKRSVVFEFNYDEQPLVERLVAAAKEVLGENVSHDVLRTIPAGTLKKLLKGLYENGDKFPETIFNAKTFSQAKIAMAKK